GVPLATFILILIFILVLMAFIVWQLKDGFTKRLSGVDSELTRALALAEANYNFAKERLTLAETRITELKSECEERDNERVEEINRLIDNSKLLDFQQHKTNKRNDMMIVALEWHGRAWRSLQKRAPDLVEVPTDIPI
ncbi:MAG TPA: hypothetical protein VN843_06770, partial [Anaerolineales bacterium]|nr:hypothetical protein [Anaerolineales bacterium]